MTECTHKSVQGEDVEIRLVVGLDKILCHETTLTWANSDAEFLKHVVSTYPNVQDQIALLDAYGIQDRHWNWSRKSIMFDSAEYIWFYLMAEGKVQALAITYHPKASRIDGAKKLFYIEYLAVAPWNRRGFLPSMKYKGLGSKLISKLLEYFPEKYGYQPGFCLHTLAQAHEYYLRIGMQDLGPDTDYHNLHYLEFLQSSLSTEVR